MTEPTTHPQTIIRTKNDYAVLDEDDFGVPGLVAYEIIGPFVDIKASGPLIMVHDGHFEPRRHDAQVSVWKDQVRAWS